MKRTLSLEYIVRTWLEPTRSSWTKVAVLLFSFFSFFIPWPSAVRILHVVLCAKQATVIQCPGKLYANVHGHPTNPGRDVEASACQSSPILKHIQFPHVQRFSRERRSSPSGTTPANSLIPEPALSTPPALHGLGYGVATLRSCCMHMERPTLVFQPGNGSIYLGTWLEQPGGRRREGRAREISEECGYALTGRLLQPSTRRTPARQKASVRECVGKKQRHADANPLEIAADQCPDPRRKSKYRHGKELQKKRCQDRQGGGKERCSIM
ncbi:hypothetical protein ASPZODRAFT_1844409 [Penicilliopsis zonata CBS 506.65]|uniref:Uncharacterized protein n=1 Tax=Penicilliopsis zonata CBS 506.65 TaxID=1073090 RepID=A0A1L9SI32_9EURO|nr:hypothetical protein ASPZODRAFT_1844409 [Penicilliopsis zonata CBS 506.65]OJJ46882.1 hypothetical protein ASPZODRAFT_1844409 [Penicilliopsis zonata CBS 506.65]